MEHLWSLLSMLALAGLSLFLILIVLLQRGRGGGLAGAFGGAGGSSALGTRAGDVFTKITIGLAIGWIVLSCINIYVLKAATERFEEVRGAGAATVPAVTPAPADSVVDPGSEAPKAAPNAGSTSTLTLQPGDQEAAADANPADGFEAEAGDSVRMPAAGESTGDDAAVEAPAEAEPVAEAASDDAPAPPAAVE